MSCKTASRYKLNEESLEMHECSGTGHTFPLYLIQGAFSNSKREIFHSHSRLLQDALGTVISRD